MKKDLISYNNSRRQWKSGNQLLQVKATKTTNSAHNKPIRNNHISDEQYLADLNISVHVGKLKQKNEAKVRRIIRNNFW